MLKIFAISTLLILASGCSHEPLDVAPMGDAFRQQLYAQQVEPGYAAPTPVTGLNGKSAVRVHEGYVAGGSDSDDSKTAESILKANQ